MTGLGIIAVEISESGIPSSAVARAALHWRLHHGTLRVNLVDLSDTLAVLSTWQRRVRNDHEVWAMQEPGFLPAKWVRLDEERNLTDLELLYLGYSTREGPFVDFLNLRVGPVYLKGRGAGEGLMGEVWISVLR